MKKILLILLILITIFYWQQNEDLKSKLSDLQDEVSNLVNERDSYIDALEQANSNIEDAQYSAWETYDDMGYALENLETVNP